MGDMLQTSLKNLIENKANPDEIELLQSAFVSGQIFIGGNAQNSVVIVGSGNTIQLSPEAIERLAAVNYLSALHELRQPPADFVGRNKELKKILTNIEKKGGAAISGLIGMAGIGKTALGLVVAHSLVNKYPDAQFFIDLRGTSDSPLKPIDVMKQVVQSFHPAVNLQNSTEDELVRAYQSNLAEKKTILFLDNAHNASQIMSLRPSSNSLMIVTSRFRFTIPGLQSIELNFLNKNESIKLLREICPRLTRKEAHRIAELCGNLPIALRLAGSFLQIHVDWSVDEYISDLTDKTKRMQSLKLEGAEINVEASFEQSYQQLSLEEKKYWCSLSIFPASFNRDALVALWEIDNDEARKIAGKLHQYSLLEYDSLTNRYRLHDLLADFADTKIVDSDKEIANIRYLKHYYAIWLESERLYDLGNENIKKGVSLFDNEYLHIKYAFELAKEMVSNNFAAHRILDEIPDFLKVLRTRLTLAQKIEWHETLLVAAEKNENIKNQNIILGHIGMAFDEHGQSLKGIDYYEKALLLAHKVGDNKHEGAWLGDLGAAHASLGDQRKGITYFEQALEIARKNNDKQREGSWVSNLGTAYLNLGEFQKAIDYYESGITLSKNVGDRRQIGVFLGNIGWAYSSMGEKHRGIEYFEQALELSRETGDRLREGLWIGNIGVVYLNLNEHIKAIEYFDQALEIAQELGDQQKTGLWLGYKGETLVNLSKNEEGVSFLLRALNISKDIGDSLRQAMWLGNLGVAYFALDQYQNSNQYYDQALEISTKIGDRFGESKWLNHYGVLYEKMGEFDKAKTAFQKSIIISKELGVRELEAKALFNFAKLLHLENDKLAFEYAKSSLSLFESIKSLEAEKVSIFINSFA